VSYSVQISLPFEPRFLTSTVPIVRGQTRRNSPSLHAAVHRPFHREDGKNAKKVGELVHDLLARQLRQFRYPGNEVHGRGMSDT
jgi:hypothetical protein